MRDRLESWGQNRFVVWGASILLIVVAVVVIAVLFYEDDKDEPVVEVDIPQIEVVDHDGVGVVIPEERQLVDWDVVGDRNEDGEYNVLDLVLYVQAGGE